VKGRTARFRTRLGALAGALPEAALDDALDVVVERGEQRLAHRPVTRDVFVDHVAAALARGNDAVELDAIEQLSAPDLYFACALGAGDARALEIAEAELMPIVRRAAGRIDANAAFVDEVAQRVRTRLFVGESGESPAILTYRGAGPLARWVRVIASRIALDLKRDDAKQDLDVDAVARLPAPDDPELALIWRTCADEYKRALTAAFARLGRRDRNLMRQRYLDDLNIDALGRLYRVHPSTAFRWIRDVEKRLAAETRTALMEKLSLTESQVRSMERMVASQLHISLGRMLRAERATKKA
jgi:RNA polymerase sigma-70 factor, ECF subfamily